MFALTLGDWSLKIIKTGETNNKHNRNKFQTSILFEQTLLHIMTQTQTNNKFFFWYKKIKNNYWYCKYVKKIKYKQICRKHKM